MTERKALADAVQRNKAMAREMANVRSSSALLAELRQLMPQAISLDQARSVAMHWSSVARHSCQMVCARSMPDAVAGAIRSL